MENSKIYNYKDLENRFSITIIGKNYKVNCSLFELQDCLKPFYFQYNNEIKFLDETLKLSIIDNDTKELYEEKLNCILHFPNSISILSYKQKTEEEMFNGNYFMIFYKKRKIIEFAVNEEKIYLTSKVTPIFQKEHDFPITNFFYKKYNEFDKLVEKNIAQRDDNIYILYFKPYTFILNVDKNLLRVLENNNLIYNDKKLISFTEKNMGESLEERLNKFKILKEDELNEDINLETILELFNINYKKEFNITKYNYFKKLYETQINLFEKNLMKTILKF